MAEKTPAMTDLFRIDREWAFALAICTVADFDFLRGILIEWTQDGAALSAVELDVFELGEYSRPPGHDAGYANEVVQVARTKVA
jgi:GAF domain-containing protein